MILLVISDCFVKFPHLNTFLVAETGQLNQYYDKKGQDSSLITGPVRLCVTLSDINKNWSSFLFLYLCGALDF